MSGLEHVVARLRRAQIPGELWVNGSFLTSKIDPQDVDVVLRIDGTWYDQASPNQRDTIDWLSTDLKPAHHCDAYFFCQYPDGDPLYWHGEYMYSYWMRQWGFDRKENEKGIAVIVLLGSDT